MQLLPENETSCPHADGRGISPAGRKTPGVYRLSVSARHGRAAAASAAASASGDRPCARLSRRADDQRHAPARAQALLLAAPALYKINISLHSFEANVAGSFDDYLSGCFTFAKLAAETGKLVDLRLWNLDGETTRGQHTQNDAILAALEAVFPQPWTRNAWGLRLCERVFVHYAEKFDWPDLSVSEQRDTGTCRALKDQLAVLSDGTVVPCCLDHEGDVPLGNLFSQELDEILRALPAQALLSGFAARKLTQPLCRRCGYARRFR